MLDWLRLQIEWLKSFVSHGTKNGEQQKGKTQSIAVLVVLWVFAFSYIRVALATQSFVDVPMNWGFLIAFAIGAKIYDSSRERKENGKLEDKSNGAS